MGNGQGLVIDQVGWDKSCFMVVKETNLSGKV
jgi:hypothetical protein